MGLLVARDDLARHQQPPRISKDAKLKGKAKAVVRPAAELDVLDVIIGQGVMAQQRFMVGRQVKEHYPLAGIQNLSSWQGIVLNER